MKKIALIIALFVFGGNGAYAQEPRLESPAVKLGNLDSANVSYEDLLQNRQLHTADNSWIVMRFTITMTLPTGKTYGPYETYGSSLDAAEMKVIKKLKGKNAEISISQIYVADGKREIPTYPIMLRYNK